MVNYEQLLEGSRVFVLNEGRDAMYKVATHLVSEFWGKPRDITDGLGVLLLTWNQAFYRYGSFDFNSLEKCLTKNMDSFQQFRKRDIFSYNNKDNDIIGVLFADLLEALQNEKGRSPVAVSKALHLLAPSFFPLWDNKIAQAYNCYWSSSNEAALKYIFFMRKTQQLAGDILKSYASSEVQDRQKPWKVSVKNAQLICLSLNHC